MHNQKRKKGEQKQIPPPSGNKPQVINSKVLSPHDIEREILQKKIESLNYALRQQTRKNAKLEEQLHWANKCVEAHVLNKKTKEELIQTLRSNYSNLIDCFISSAQNYAELSRINRSLIQGQEWKPQIREMIEAISIPICSN